MIYFNVPVCANKCVKVSGDQVLEYEEDVQATVHHSCFQDFEHVV